MRHSTLLLITFSCLSLRPGIAAELKPPEDALPRPRGGVRSESESEPAAPNEAALDQSRLHVVQSALNGICSIAQEEPTPEELMECAIISAQGLKDSWWACIEQGIPVFGGTLDRMCDGFRFAGELRVIVGRLKDGQNAQLLALRTRAQADRVLAMIEADYRNERASLSDVSRARYESHMAAASLAQAEGDRDAEIAARKQAVADSEIACAAWEARGTAGLPIGSRLLEASARRCEAKLALIDVTMADPATASEARVAAIDEHMAPVTERLNTERLLEQVGHPSTPSESRCDHEKTAALLAHHRGDNTSEVVALERAIEASEMLRRMYEAARREGLPIRQGANSRLAEAERCRCEAKVAMINATMSDTAEARKARQAARRRYADELHDVLRRVRAECEAGVGSPTSMFEGACRYLLVRLQMVEDKQQAREEGAPQATPTDSESPIACGRFRWRWRVNGGSRGKRVFRRRRAPNVPWCHPR